MPGNEADGATCPPVTLMAKSAGVAGPPTTTVVTLRCAAWSSLVMVQVTDSPSASVIALPLCIPPPVQLQALAS